MSGERLLYLGDGELATAARYLAAILTRAGIAFDHHPSATPCPTELLDAGHDGFVLSDYPAQNLSASRAERLIARVSDGAGLLMIGGWSSFVGSEGNYQRSRLATILPVDLERADDRENHWGTCVVERAGPCASALPARTAAGWPSSRPMPLQRAGSEPAGRPRRIAPHFVQPGGSCSRKGSPAANPSSRRASAKGPWPPWSATGAR